MIGYEDTVVPQIINAILARQNFILLGLRGQAKSRIIRQLIGLLDEVTPILRGSEVNDDPFRPISKHGRTLLEECGDSAGIVIALSFLVAEIILTRYGHTRAGYSAGGLFFSFGDALAVISVVASGNKGFQVTLALMAGAWLIGAARAPIAWLGERRSSAAMVAAADALQPIVGIATQVLRIPGIVTGLAGGNYIGAAAIACWRALASAMRCLSR